MKESPSELVKGMWNALTKSKDKKDKSSKESSDEDKKRMLGSGTASKVGQTLIDRNKTIKDILD